MTDIARVIDTLWHFIDGVHVFRIGLPIPIDAFEHGAAGNVLGAFQVAEDEISFTLTAGGESEPAITHHRRGDPVIAGAAAERIPEHLRVHMSVAVDKTRRYNMAFRVNRILGGFASNHTNFGDFAIFHTDVTAIAGAAGTVDNHAVFDNQIVAHIACPSQFP